MMIRSLFVITLIILALFWQACQNLVPEPPAKKEHALTVLLDIIDFEQCEYDESTPNAVFNYIYLNTDTAEAIESIRQRFVEREVDSVWVFDSVSTEMLRARNYYLAPADSSEFEEYRVLNYKERRRITVCYQIIRSEASLEEYGLWLHRQKICAREDEE